MSIKSLSFLAIFTLPHCFFPGKKFPVEDPGDDLQGAGNGDGQEKAPETQQFSAYQQGKDYHQWMNPHFFTDYSRTDKTILQLLDEKK